MHVVEQYSCQVCSEAKLEAIDLYATLPRVTSDCKPWPTGGTLTVCRSCGTVQKLPDAKWLDEITQIYDAYQIYNLSGGAEQVIFDGAGDASPRSRRLVDYLTEKLSLPAEGKLIDIGCGNGAAIANFSRALPGWSLYGSELTDTALPFLSQLPNFVELFTVEPDSIPEKFDIVSMIHSLEHMPDPSKSVTQISHLLRPGGMLCIEIPDVETSPFDLIVADHMSHFSRATLSFLVERNGFYVDAVRNDMLPKEITLVATMADQPSKHPDPNEGMRFASTHVKWLRAVLDKAKVAAATSNSFGLFGTSISGMWLFGALKDQVDFFVDEDQTRIGGSFEGKPIVAPSSTPSGATVFVPLIPSVADRVAARLADLDIELVLPPPIAS